MAQILAEMGMGSGNGTGMGAGSGMGGYSARRGNFGLYGGLPGMTGGGGSEFGGRQGSEDDPGGNFTGGTGGRNPDRDSLVDEDQSGGASGIGEGAIPLRYRRPVGEYFQRVAEEVGER